MEQQHTAAAAVPGPSSGWHGGRSAGGAHANAAAAPQAAAALDAGACGAQPGHAEQQFHTREEEERLQHAEAPGDASPPPFNWADDVAWHDDGYEEPVLVDAAAADAAAHPLTADVAEYHENEDAAAAGDQAPRMVECSTTNKGILLDRWCSLTCPWRPLCCFVV